MTRDQIMKEYNERYRFWSNQILSQFGYTQNLFTTIGFGFLGYLISIRHKYPEIIINSSLPLDWNFVFYLFTILLVFVSVFFGSISIISRLYDLRLTRHIISTRKEVFKKHNKSLPDNFIDLKKESLSKAFFKVLFCQIGFIKNTEINEIKQVELKFENIRKLSKILGSLSWKSHKIQLMILFFSVLIYSLTIFN